MLPTMAPLPPAPLTLPDGRPLHDLPENHRDSSGLALPPVFSFAAVVGGASKTYWHDRFDEAMRHSRENALAMRRDAYLMSLLQERKFAVSSLPWYLEVPDPKDKTQAKVRATLTQCLRGTRGLRRMLLAWLEAIWYGRYGVQFAWRWQQVEGRRALAVKDWAPVNGDKIGYHWDGTPYVLVNAARAGELTGAVLVNTTRARALSLQGGWRQRFVIHQHEIDDADYFEAEAAGGRHGVGIRSRIYWLDFLKREYLDWVVTYLERVGLGTTFWKYDAGNPKAKEQAEQAALDNSRRVNIVVPVWPDSRGGFSGGVERIEAPMGGVESLRTMIEAMDAYIERYVVGQAGSSRSQSSGLGNEAASEFMASTKDAIRDHDAHLLAETITGDEAHPGLISLFQQYTFPEFAPGTPNGFPVLFKFGLEKSLNNQRVQSIQQIVQLGLPVRKDDIYNAAGLSRPEEQDDVLEPPQQGMGGAGGDNPLAALMGGGGAPGAPARGGTPEEGGDAPASEDDIDAFLDELLGGGGGDEPEGDTASEDEVDDFLSELLGGGEDDDQPQQMARQGRGVEQYGWVMTKELGDGRKRWKGTEEHKGQYRTQKIEPGTRVKSSGDNRRSIGEHIDTLLESPESFTPEHRADLRAKLLTLTRDQFAALRAQFGIRKKGRRKEEEVNTLLEGVEEKKKPKVEEAKAVEPADSKKPRRINLEQFLKEKGMRFDPMSEAIALDSPSGSMSGRAERAAKERFGENYQKYKEVVEEYQALVDAGKVVDPLGKHTATPVKSRPEYKQAKGEVDQYLRRIHDAQIMGMGKGGRMKPSWKRMVDDAEAGLQKLFQSHPELASDYPDLAQKYGPQEGDTNAEGLVFRDGQWRREDGGEKTARIPLNAPEDGSRISAQPSSEQGGRKQEGGTMTPQNTEEWKQFNRRPVGAANKGKRGKLVISGRTREIKDLLKARGWKYDAATQTWSNDLVAAHADIIRDGGEARVEFLKGLNGWKKGVKIQLDGEDVFVDSAHPTRAQQAESQATSQQASASPAQAASAKRVRYTSGKTGAPVVGQMLRDKDGTVVVVTSVDKPVYREDEARYVHAYQTRPATPEEASAAERQSKIAELQKELARYEAPPDDEQDLASFNQKAAELRQQLAALQG